VDSCAVLKDTFISHILDQKLLINPKSVLKTKRCERLSIFRNFAMSSPPLEPHSGGKDTKFPCHDNHANHGHKHEGPMKETGFSHG